MFQGAKRPILVSRWRWRDQLQCWQISFLKLEANNPDTWYVFVRFSIPHWDVGPCFTDLQAGLWKENIVPLRGCCCCCWLGFPHHSLFLSCLKRKAHKFPEANVFHWHNSNMTFSSHTLTHWLDYYVSPLSGGDVWDVGKAFFFCVKSAPFGSKIIPLWKWNPILAE